MKKDNAPINQIRQAVMDQKKESIEKYGNKSKIGLIINQENDVTLENLLGITTKRQQKRQVSDFNR